ncbi:MAG: hypothetical protein OEL57_07260 [Trichlorobacter sp.]|uniref:hypothetical protein n=1 Tax=Trichlorobacter sp. TaxID=2911007 RepID=UPI00256ADF99|nr:hypothetical protein [Trichlorobacter sp.]MDK9717693.1 hypothetical protein [Trichlorobacter sp.]
MVELENREVPGFSLKFAYIRTQILIAAPATELSVIEGIQIFFTGHQYDEQQREKRA